MLKTNTRFCFLFILIFVFSYSHPTKPRLTFDEFFDATAFSTLSLSPTNEHLFFGTRRASWNTSSFENALWIYEIQKQTKKLITRNLHKTIQPKWSPNGLWIALLLDQTSANATHADLHAQSISNNSQTQQCIHLYSPESNELLSVELGDVVPLEFTWSDTDLSLYVAVSNKSLPSMDDEWKGAIEYRRSKSYEHSSIIQVDIVSAKESLSAQTTVVSNLSFYISELIFVSVEQKLFVISASLLLEDLNLFEIYSIDLRNTSSPPVRLTHNEDFESNLKLSPDCQHLLFQTITINSNDRILNNTQISLYALNLLDGQFTRLAQDFHGSIHNYMPTSDGIIYILGQLGTEIHLYSLESLSSGLTEHVGWNGSYETLTVTDQHSMATVYSSTDTPQEIYFINDIDQLQNARPITSENHLFTERDLPQALPYRWENKDDHRTVEGMLHYPPGKYLSKNLPLLVLIHGGPYAASINHFSPNWYTWAALAASEGWLVLEPNYRGSTGYGDAFLQEIRYRPLQIAGQDILHGVDQLIRDGIADPHRLTVGGYSYGGFLTNWLITQTKQFNAALSGAGSIDHTSSWGTMDMPTFLTHLFGGYPWETSHIYQSQSPIYQIDRIRTPTLITTGEADIRVPASQSYILERALYYRGVPVKLFSFPREGHELSDNPWHGKIKVREEIKWLKQYGHQSLL
ncbi:unnamed protein product [Adineta ricciae]|uniref:Peptidase S9 prolyl oligopeptidase catalytic domain-containing protein n=2 Tax=Adineta ricciae TaxID=249248 RepID=A0A813SDQ6_ADIRI|nr:unnamed protein product [Adineta ricciae]CAF1526489.1 unnamed protein product [Adineta ricciae]